MEEIASAQPLDQQFGAIELTTLPVEFFEYFFGESPLSYSSEVIADVKSVSMFTYAIIDAAKVDQFVQIIGTSDLEHLCLFQGEAQNELEDVAPWIVRLEYGNKFTRHLFSFDGKTPWFLADKDVGMYFRSSQSLVELKRHFRKYTKVKDESGKWYYFRFWEPRWARNLLTAMSKEDLEQFFEPIDTALVMSWSNVEQRLHLSILRKPAAVEDLI